MLFQASANVHKHVFCRCSAAINNDGVAGNNLIKPVFQVTLGRVIVRALVQEPVIIAFLETSTIYEFYQCYAIQTY